MANTLPPDVVPALSTALFAITGVVLVVVTDVYYVLCLVHDPRSSLRNPRAVLTS
jgi:hypothetical protein